MSLFYGLGMMLYRNALLQVPHEPFSNWVGAIKNPRIHLLNTTRNE